MDQPQMSIEDATPPRADPATPPTSKGRATRLRIEKALRELLETSPYSSIRMSDIAQHAGLSVGARSISTSATGATDELLGAG